ncbi:hypothetical protein SAMN06265374_3146 [Roseibium denhamense]|uniref:Uncharacterized protein n=1 Tax=Roseibium denhamense TaxID=76305 RepID=A0ABY1PB84_9HYPH|nr:hypothetical protein SAMN06265374_3146 [Roseibium denhamense]
MKRTFAAICTNARKGPILFLNGPFCFDAL